MQVNFRSGFLARASVACALAIVQAMLFSACSRQSGEYYLFAEPEVAPEDVTTGATAKIIPTLLRITDIEFHNATLDPSVNDGNASITYTLPEPGFVTIRIAREATRELYLATLLNLEFRDAGTHTEIWDGRDYYGNRLNEMGTPFSYRMQAESIAEGSPPPGHRGLDYLAGESQEEAIIKADWRRHVHTWHESKYEHIPLLTISSPRDDESLSGIATVRSAVDHERRGFGDKYGYGVRYYVDNEIVHEEFYLPESGGQFLFELDTTAFDDGKHTLHVGMCDHNDHVTSHGVDVVFDNLGVTDARKEGLLDRRYVHLGQTKEEDS